MKKILMIGLLAGGALFVVGSASADVRRDFRDGVSRQMDNLENGLDRLGRTADRLARFVDRTASRFIRGAERELARTVRERSSNVSSSEARSRVSSEDRANQSQEGERFTWTGRIRPGETLEIKGMNGSVHAEASPGDEIEVVALKEGRRSDPAYVVIEVVEHSGGVTVCAVYPSRGSRKNECEPGSDGRMSVRNNDVDVEFHVRVPAGVRFVAKTVNGEIEATQLEADVVASTVNGSIYIGTTGYAEATTVNGSIEASLGAHGWEDALKFNTVNGSITVEMPADLDAEIDASWVSGGITSDVPLTMQGKFGARRARGVIGSGGPMLELSTVNGEIRLREAGS